MMIEAEWQTSRDPRPMLRFLIGTASHRVQDVEAFPDSRGSGRKLRLFACTCYYRICHLLPHSVARTAIEVAERVAAGEATSEEWQASEAYIRELLEILEPRWRASRGAERKELEPTYDALALAGIALWDAPQKAAYYAASNAHLNIGSITNSYANQTAEERSQCGILREIFGNPFRPITFDPAWRTTDVNLLAKGIYEERAFDRMPILADALQDAGCGSDEILNHLRDPQAAHVRGCWALDLVLGKE